MKIYDRNSFTGAANGGMMPCPDIAKAVAATGRVGIELTARMVESPYSEIPRDTDEPEDVYRARCKKIRDSYPIPKLEEETQEEHTRRISESVQIIYGDTDSVMVRQTKTKTAAEGIELGRRYAKWISEHFFTKPMVRTLQSKKRSLSIRANSLVRKSSSRRYTGRQYLRSLPSPLLSYDL
jgi:DNA polymerase elongation subunit (family B)